MAERSEAQTAGKTAGKGKPPAKPPKPDSGPAAGSQQPEKPKATAGPRPYKVLRSFKGSELPEGYADAEVFVVVGEATAKTAKEARRAIAKEKVDEAELKTENGVELRAVAGNAFDAGVGRVKLKTEPVWED